MSARVDPLLVDGPRPRFDLVLREAPDGISERHELVGKFKMHRRRLPDLPARYFLILDPRRTRIARDARRDVAHEDHAKSRADLQAELRKSRKKEQKRKHRWRRRTLYALSFLIVLAAVGAGGLYFYADYRFDQIKKVHAKHLIRTAPVSEQKPFNMLLVGSDTRAFVDNPTQANAFGTDAAEAASAATSRWPPASTPPPRP